MEHALCQRAWLTLLRTPGMGARHLRQLVRDAGGDIELALEQARHGRWPGLDDRARGWLRAPDAKRVASDLDWLAQPRHRLLCFTDADYPPQLEQAPHAPAAMYAVGNTQLLLRPQLAVVGARSASPAGRTNAGAFARALSRRGVVITSGLAEGIDAAAHEAALAEGGGTIAVVGTGPDRVYPRRNRVLSAAIAEQGLVVSEFAPGTGARAQHFPRRNRIISGLTLGTLVVEAGVRSGSLITARLAGDYGREVYALPGSIHNPLARGCHRLIREGARLVETVDEILQSLVPLARAQGHELAARLAADAGVDSPSPTSQIMEDPQSRRLLDALGHDVATLDELHERSGLEPAELSSMLLMLELEGRVAGVAGGRYQRLD
ncbi:DNA-processing protein DprA [Oleiagrimonas sp.]|jgi:DNA processing protein|uniref:DNA-processing protein DprA n=1 Tax=Oleiagrimonas sp. TaxID=2010330 RepID=UPI00262B3109|nr:DNA-processing protein DprA [Oleiagrimonas sp.]MDA3912908.1 DNA-processing protein DprA [Oleiagrimonas sp.]